MSWTTESAFDSYFEKINLPGDRREIANTRREWIVRRLRNGGLTIVDSFSMGSIPRFTALRDHADLDIMVVLHYGKHIENRKPSAVLSVVKSALGAGAGGVRRNGQAVTMKFQSWPDVDVVPASRSTDNAGSVTGYKIPDMTREIWLPTDPPKHSRDIESTASQHGPKFRRVVKMLKDWNRRQAVKLQSYHLEVIALKIGCQDWSEHSWPLHRWFFDSPTLVDFCWHEGQDISSYLSNDHKSKLKGQLRTASSVALSAWHAAHQGSHEVAITRWRTVFGQQFPTYG